YFRRKPPKSTGREEFGAPYIEKIEARARELNVGGEDLMATVTALTAKSIAEACRRFIMPLGQVHQLIATGGGARNPTLIGMIGRELDGVDVTAASQIGVDGDAGVGRVCDPGVSDDSPRAGQRAIGDRRAFGGDPRQADAAAVGVTPQL
ncbi:MAG TPA: anhydro-N-acetylmuramic acid kinase, partial [Candidatus Binataceae bacterium]|nr:anhydro-N-acetylmuramic acid kinase [Candidatus Binataceae bacterium]